MCAESGCLRTTTIEIARGSMEPTTLAMCHWKTLAAPLFALSYVCEPVAQLTTNLEQFRLPLLSAALVLGRPPPAYKPIICLAGLSTTALDHSSPVCLDRLGPIESRRGSHKSSLARNRRLNPFALPAHDSAGHDLRPNRGQMVRLSWTGNGSTYVLANSTTRYKF